MQREGAAAIVRGSSSFPKRRARPVGVTRDGIAAVLVYAIFFLLIALPLALVLVQAVLPSLFDVGTSGWTFSLAPLRRTFGSSRVALSIIHSVVLAGTVAISATAFGGAFALLVQRCNIPMRRMTAIVPWIVFLTPSYLKALAWVLLMSPGGYLAQLGLLPPAVGHAFFGLSGLVFAHTLSLFPLATFVIGSALAGLGSDMEDAARVLGVRPLKVWLSINGPLLAPAIALSGIAIFAEVLSDFGMASTIARMSSFGVLTYGIYAAASDYPVDFPLAGSQALILLALVLAVVLFDRLLRRQADPRLISGRSKPARTCELGVWRWPAAGATLLIAVLAIYLPLAAILTRALSRTLGAGLAWSNLTATNLIAAVSLGTSANGALLRSLWYAALTALIAAAGALLLSVQLDRSKRFMRPLIVGLSLGAVAIPGIVLGFGYILVWNRLPGFRDWPFPHYGDASLLVMGYVAAALPYCLVIIMSAVGQLAPSLHDAARLHGVNARLRLVRITLPLVFMGVATAFLLTFIRTVFELPVSQMLIPLNGSPAPPVILRLFSHDQDGLASALSLTTMALAGTSAGLLWLAAGRVALLRGTALPFARAEPSSTTGGLE